MVSKVLLRPTLAALAVALVSVAIWGCTAVSGLPPVVSYTVPAELSGNVPFASTISAVFSRTMDPATITASSFTVSVGGTAVTGTVSCTGDTATFTPASLLPGNSLVTATVTSAAKDVNGMALAADRTWTFMTVPTLTAGNIALYYAYTVQGGTWTRNLGPGTYSGAGANVVSQSYNPADGSIALAINGAVAYTDNGFYFYVGELRYLSTVKVVAAPGSGTYGANIYLDASGDGEFFTWVGDVYNNDLGGDQYYGGPSSVAGVLTIDDTSSFGGNTLAQLKAGAVAGVTGATRAAIYLGISLNTGSQATTIQTVKVN